MCPICGKHMVMFELEGVEIDYCVHCAGTWLDHGELARILETEGASSDIWERALSSARPLRKTDRACPRCPRKLREIQVATEPPVTLDRCPWGDGLWFDHGEMETIIDSFTTGNRGTVARFFADLYQVKHASKEGRD